MLNDLPLELLEVLRNCSMIVSRFLTISACFFRVASPVSGSRGAAAPLDVRASP
jgi:hypothetical protein